MGQGLSMRELQKLSSGAIRALPHAMPITNGAETVALLLPLRPPAREQVRTALDTLDAVQAQWSEDDRIALERFLRERGAEV